MSKYTYDYEEWSQDTRSYTVECSRKLTEDEVHFAMSEAEVDYEEGGTTHKIPLDDGVIAIVTYHGNEWGDTDCEIINGKENLVSEKKDWASR